MKTYIAVGVIALGTTAFAHSGVKDPDVMNRMMGMSEMAKQMKVLGAMAKGEQAFDAAAVDAALVRMAEEASYIPSLFEPKATDPKSEALPVIWNEFDTFEEHARALEKTSTALSGTVGTRADLGPAMKELGQACSACHSDYRQK
ncbi:MAG: cytochrome C [Maritimibacter sp.]|nr:cytochrome C [Maritimibacter sp.]